MKKYSIILADSPWIQGRGGKKKSVPNSYREFDYPTIGVGEIEKILCHAQLLTNNNHVLFLWTIDKYLWDAEKIAKSLNYKLHARMIWNKVVGIPTAFTIRFGHEYLLYLWHGKLLPVASEQRGKWHSVFTEQSTKHSKKPQIAYEMIESLYPETNKLELFARTSREGWDCWGNEVESNIEL